MSAFAPAAGGVHIAIHVVPRARRDAVDGLHGEALKVRLNAPPVDGKANAALVRFLAAALEVPRAAVALEAGLTGREKRVYVAGLTAEAARARLLVAPPG